MIKPLVLFCAVFFAAGAAAFGQAPPSNTADYYTLKPEVWLEKPVTLSVAWLDVTSSAELKDGYRQMRAETINLNRWGGYIEVLAPPDVAARIIKLCGTQHYKNQIGVVPHTINGVFTKVGNEYAVKVDK